MNRPGERWYVRGAAAGAVALLLAGCGSGDGGDGKGGASKPLGRAALSSVLPDAKALPGWRTVMKPEAQKPVAEYPPPVCQVVDKKKRQATCGEITFWGVSSFVRKPDVTSLNFWALAYKDEKTADAAYDALNAYYGGDRVGVGAKPVGIGEPGAEREANRAATGTMGGPATVTQLRVGTLVLGISTGTQGKASVPDGEVKALAAMLADRAQQAQDGEKPSAAVTG
ncbi:hypothetical protein EDD93_2148 [Streptomyces sp. 840.1]|uniref:hypothetical protein n=1 Tax=Streptomyces sp. 840.1 TaxID=2485152 RepID=UPI000F48F187|nr:hypothetical protein [Streptomyces sp. 840.1]ROQ67703.1 hypothetical protein EDD93_2148 [Streptomyces sp. 840.1]